MFRYVILGLLRDGASRHGYALMKAYRDRAGVQIGTGNFYRELQRLVADGLVRTAPRLEDADPRQAPYAITPAGVCLFDQWFADPSEALTGWNFEDQLSARILFLGDVAAETGLKVLQKWQDDLWVRAKVLERVRDAAAASATGTPAFPALSLLLNRRMRHLAADLALIDDVRGTYTQWIADTREREVPAERTNAARGIGRRATTANGARQAAAVSKAAVRSHSARKPDTQ